MTTHVGSLPHHRTDNAHDPIQSNGYTVAGSTMCGWKDLKDGADQYELGETEEYGLIRKVRPTRGNHNTSGVYA